MNLAEAAVQLGKMVELPNQSQPNQVSDQMNRPVHHMYEIATVNEMTSSARGPADSPSFNFSRAEKTAPIHPYLFTPTNRGCGRPSGIQTILPSVKTLWFLVSPSAALRHSLTAPASFLVLICPR